MDLYQALLLMGLGFSLAAPIGPVNAEMLRQTLSRPKGWILGMITGLGAMSGDFIIASIATYWESEVLKERIDNVWVKVPLFTANAILLCYIAWNAWNAEIYDNVPSHSASVEDGLHGEIEQRDEARRPFPVQYAKGFVLVTTSPWSYVWWASFGTYLLGLNLELDTVNGRLLVVFFFLAGILAWVVIFCGALGISRKFANKRVLLGVTRASAILLIGFALLITWDAVEALVA